MTISEYSDLDHRVQKLETKINKCLDELASIKSEMKNISGQSGQESSKKYSHFYDNHTPYFDVIGENSPKNHKII